MNEKWKRNVFVFLASQAISLFGSSLVQYAITWHITLTTNSGVYATISIICGFLPTFFLSPFAGVWADRYNRKTLIIIADSSIALCTLILAILFLNGKQHIGFLFVALTIRALGSAVQTPCVGAMLPDIAPEQHLTRINGINNSINAAINLASPLLGAFLLNKSKLENIFFIDVFTALIAVTVVFFFLKVAKKEKRESLNIKDYFNDLKLGFSYIKSQKFLTHIFIYIGIFYILMAPPAFLTQLQVKRSYGGGPNELAMLEVVFAIGMIIGGIVISAWGGFKNKVNTIAFSLAIFALTTIAMGIKTNLTIYLVFMGLCGVSVPIFNTPATTLLQQKVAPEFMGRVFGVFTMLSSSLMPIGMLIFGPIADLILIEWILLFCGIFMLLLINYIRKDRELIAVG